MIGSSILDGDTAEVFDDLVIGAGSSGAVIASRLSEDPGRRVLLVESGPDYALADVAQEIRSASQPAVVPGLNWKIRALVREETQKRRPGAARDATGGAVGTFDYESGRLMGGSSAINAVQALRGTPEDFAEWAAACGEAWSWQGVLPYYRALEDDPVGSELLHGRGGPVPITRERRDELRPLAARLVDACVALGYAETADHNDPETTGIGVIPKNVVDGVRMSTALTYLSAARGRPNLVIAPNTHVHRITWSSSHACSGIEASTEGRLVRLEARRVIVSAGAMNTPALLLRSGLGAPASLRALGIETRIPLAGVGVGFMDHPVVSIWAVPKPGVSNLGDPMRQTLLRYTSGRSGFRNDMHVCVMAGVDARIMPERLRATLGAPVIVGVSATVMKSRSRGSVSLASADPLALPRVVVDCLADEADVPLLEDGVSLAWELVQHPMLASQLDRVLAWTNGMIASPAARKQAIKAFVRPAAHACGSVRMGRSPDEGAVVDPQARVHGVDNLWVADASIMPTIPCAPPNLTCIMIGEKIADSLRGVS